MAQQMLQTYRRISDKRAVVERRQQCPPFSMYALSHKSVHRNVWCEAQCINRGVQAVDHAHLANRDVRLHHEFPARPSPQPDRRGHSAA